LDERSVFVTGRGPVSKAQLRCCLSPILDEDVLLVSDGNALHRYFARDAGISHQAVKPSKGIRVKGAIHVQNVNADHSRFREWIASSTESLRTICPTSPDGVGFLMRIVLAHRRQC
jgi:hypothetical protein